ncbi:PLP-dependent aminotransferase family protein [Fulvivirgaceae bacterium BMA12]|uniref:PLP-dependent aminotransferase family protein n=1 Tax=Agaribacillus aureus TaxID=3051825 RepID=A0ABT8LIA9_9BACT|nr:PLP-dependent aminotransferase family protein [Fulvivirgaceae bacterium BMA12]
MLPFKSIIEIDKHQKSPVYLQIVNSIIREINSGRIATGQKLPGSREMAGLLNLNRKTVIMAYDELMAQGWVETHPSRGSFISTELPKVNYQKIQPETRQKGQPALEKCGFPIVSNRYLEAPVYAEHSMLEIDEGSPDERLAPIEDLYRYCKAIARSKAGRKLLKYHDVQGEISFRKSLSKYLSETRGLHYPDENIFITRGSQMAIYLIFNTLVKKHDNVIVGASNYGAANAVIKNLEANLLKVPVDDNGIVVSAIEEACQRTNVRAVYITPHHHFPTTVTLSAQRRIELLKLAEKYRFVILEDDYDYDYHYSSSPILPLASLDHQGLVIYVGAFSKLLAPSIRIGYLAAPMPLIRELRKLRKIIDRQGDPIMEKALGEMIREGELQRHLKKSVRIYKERRDLFCRLLQENLGDHVDFKVPAGGMVVWTRFGKHIDLAELAQALKRKKIFIGIQKDFVLEHNAIRFGFASLNEREIYQSIASLKETLEELVG